jgi:regulator of protease activity HflC (stomatin/prohibitin superfamily)
MSTDEAKLVTKVIKYVVLGIVILILFFGSFAFVVAGEVGVVTRFGAVNRVVNPGLILKFPLVEHVVRMDTRTQKDQVDAQAASQDLQIVKSTIAVNYHLDGTRATDVYQKIGTDYQDKVVSPSIQDTFKATTAQYTAEQLITERETVRSFAEKELTAKLKPYNIILDNFNIVNFDFSPEFNTAIEAKQVAQQSVETAKQLLDKAKVDAETAVATAQGQADAQKALKDTGGLSVEYVQFLAVQKWDGKLPAVTGNGVPFVNIPIK